MKIQFVVYLQAVDLQFLGFTVRFFKYDKLRRYCYFKDKPNFTTNNLIAHASA